MKPFLIKLSIETSIVEHEFKKAVKEFDSVEIITQASKQNPDLVVFELADEADLDKIQAYIEKTENTEVFLLSDNSDPNILIKTIRMGVKEFLPLPLNDDTINDALVRFMDRQKKRRSRVDKHAGYTISVVGSKGGVGTTTI
ncbi:MAG: hypothetical protein ABFR31_10060, partial [Thermodesulfobacteriota bacterium]